MLGMIAVFAMAGSCLCAQEAPGKASLDNLQAAYNGESNAKARYDAFALKADEEGYSSVAALFRAASRAEDLHAGKHAKQIKVMGAEPSAMIAASEVKSTKENLETALNGENTEKDSMYPDFIKQAEADNNEGAAMSFHGALATEKSHAELFKTALSEFEAWKAPGKEFLVCLVCGYTTLNTSSLVKCPICAAPRSKFDLIK